MMDTLDMIADIKWTIEKSPKAYGLLRDQMIDLRVALVNAELKHQQAKENENVII